MITTRSERAPYSREARNFVSQRLTCLLERTIPALERQRRQFTEGTVRLFLSVIVLPNLLFWMADIYWPLVRPGLNLDYAIVALLYPWLGARGTAVSTGLIVLLDSVVVIMYHFFGNPGALFTAVPNALYLDWLSALPLALVLIVPPVFTGIAVSRFLRKIPRRLGPNLGAPAMAVVLAIIGNTVLPPSPTRRPSHAVVTEDLIADAVIPAVSYATEFRGIVDPNVPSATGRLFARSKGAKRLPNHIVLVLVESMGRYTDPALNRLQSSPFRSAVLQERFSVRHGTVPYAPGTVRGEIRELCHAESASIRVDTLLLPIDACLPALMNGRGYHTVALHGFRGGMFDREAWWPALGFDRVMFESDIAAALGSARRCGTMFRGICDDDVRTLISGLLRSRREPLFVYWLTLNAHWPAAPPRDARAGPDCTLVPATASRPKLCNLIRRHHIVFRGIVQTALATDIRNTAYIIVGDHAPTAPSPGIQRLVDPDSVPYWILWPKT